MKANEIVSELIDTLVSSAKASERDLAAMRQDKAKQNETVSKLEKQVRETQFNADTAAREKEDLRGRLGHAEDKIRSQVREIRELRDREMVADVKLKLYSNAINRIETLVIIEPIHRAVKRVKSAIEREDKAAQSTEIPF